MAEQEKNVLTVDGKEYDADAISENARSIIRNIQFTDAELARLRLTNAAFQTARQSYVAALKRELEGGKDDAGAAASDA